MWLRSPARWKTAYPSCGPMSALLIGESFVRFRSLSISVCVLSLMLSACSTQPFGGNLSPDQQNLLMRCPLVPAQLRNGQGGEMVLVIKDVAAEYHDCATRHNGLVDAWEQLN